MQRRLPELTRVGRQRPAAHLDITRRKPRKSVALGLLLLVACTRRPGSIGAVLGQARSDGRVTIREAPPGLPAANAGLEEGDEILLIDGRDVRGMSPEGIHLALEGEVGSSVALTVLRAGKIRRVALKRAPLAAP